jgi:hypothetical protein
MGLEFQRNTNNPGRKTRNNYRRRRNSKEKIILRSKKKSKGFQIRNWIEDEEKRNA